MRGIPKSLRVLACVTVMMAGLPGVDKALAVWRIPGEDLSVVGDVNFDQPIRFKLDSRTARQCQENASANVTIQNYSLVLSSQELSFERIPVDKYVPPKAVAVFEALLPSNDTIQISITVECDTISKTSVHYCVTTDNSLKLKGVDPRTIPPKPKTYPTKGGTKHSRDTLTVEQLQKVWTCWLDLSRPEDYDKAKEILGAIPDSCHVDDTPGTYIMMLTFDLALKLAENGVEADLLNFELDRRNRPQEDSVKSIDKEEGEKDGEQKESSLLSPPGVSLDHVHGPGAPGLALGLVGLYPQ